MILTECVQNPAENPVGVCAPDMPDLGCPDLVSPTGNPWDSVRPELPPSSEPRIKPPAKRGRPPKARYVCPSCGSLTRLTRMYCCQWCHQPRIPAGTSRDALQTWWIRFLASHSWTHFGTGTFPWPLEGDNEHARLAVQSYERRFFKRLHHYDPNLAWFAVAEPNRSGQLHIHWLCNAPTLTPSFLENQWTRKYGGLTLVGPYHSGASVYSCKTLADSDLHSIGGLWQKEVVEAGEVRDVREAGECRPVKSRIAARVHPALAQGIFVPQLK